MAARRNDGRYEVTGPGIDRSSDNPRAALSMAAGFASRQAEDGDWYVREIGQPVPLWVVSKRGRATTWVRG